MGWTLWHCQKELRDIVKKSFVTLSQRTRLSAFWHNLLNKAKRFANQQRSNVDIALASVYCFYLRATKAVATRKELQRWVVNIGGTAVKSDFQIIRVSIKNYVPLALWIGDLTHTKYLQLVHFPFKMRIAITKIFLRIRKSDILISDFKQATLWFQIDHTVGNYFCTAGKYQQHLANYKF